MQQLITTNNHNNNNHPSKSRSGAILVFRGVVVGVAKANYKLFRRGASGAQKLARESIANCIAPSHRGLSCWPRSAHVRVTLARLRSTPLRAPMVRRLSALAAAAAAACVDDGTCRVDCPAFNATVPVGNCPLVLPLLGDVRSCPALERLSA